MPMPTEERVSQLIAGLTERRGFDLEGVEISTATQSASNEKSNEGTGSAESVRVVVIVDSDDAADLDTIATLSRELSEVLDTADEFGETPYLLEVTSPGTDRPLVHPRHWRRARGRKVRITLRPGASAPDPGTVSPFDARVGALESGTADSEDSVALVLGGKRKPHRVRLPLADIAEAVVQVEFSPPGARELELAGGVASGRPRPGSEDRAAGGGAADVQLDSVTVSDVSTEGIVE